MAQLSIMAHSIRSHSFMARPRVIVALAAIVLLGAFSGSACDRKTPAPAPAPPPVPSPAQTQAPSAPTNSATAAPTAPTAPPTTTPAASPTAPPTAPPSATTPPTETPAAAGTPATAEPTKTRQWRETWPNGKAKALCPMVRDPKTGKLVKHGLWQSWNEDGSNAKLGNYLYGEMDGEWKIWFPGVPNPYIEVYENGRKLPDRSGR